MLAREGTGESATTRSVLIAKRHRLEHLGRWHKPHVGKGGMHVWEAEFRPTGAAATGARPTAAKEEASKPTAGKPRP